MKQVTIALLLLTAFSQQIFSQTYLSENFNYLLNDTLVANGWSLNSGANVNTIRANSSGLMFTGYINSGIGNSAYLMSTGQDVFKDLPAPISSGSLYVSFMAKIDTVRTGDYFIALLPPSSGTTYIARIYIKLSSPGYFKAAVTKYTETPAYSADSFGIGTTYLFALKYSFHTSSSTDDSIRLYMFTNSFPSIEPSGCTSTLIQPTSTDPSSLSRVALRQGSTSSSPTLSIDGIRVGDSWSNTILPVTLLSFDGCRTDHGVELKWNFVNDVNRKNIIINRSVDSKNFTAIGNITGDDRTESSLFIFTDKEAPDEKLFYQLLFQNDHGEITFSNIVCIDGSPIRFNFIFSNPIHHYFNVKFCGNEEGLCSFSLADINGVTQWCCPQITEKGSNNYTYDVSILHSGMYTLKFNYNGQQIVKKVIKD